MSLNTFWFRRSQSRFKEPPKLHWRILTYTEHHAQHLHLMPRSRIIAIAGGNAFQRGLPACHVVKRYVNSKPPITVEFNEWMRPATATTCADCRKLMLARVKANLDDGSMVFP